MKKYILIFILLFLTNHYNFAESSKGIVSGVIVSESGDPIEFVTVFVDKSQQVTMTNERGEFSLTLPSGEHQLQFHSFNFLKTEHKVSLSDGEEKKLNVVMTESVNSLSKVVVQGKSEKKEIESKGFAVHVIETQKQALQSVQTTELLDRTVGVRVRQNGGLGSATSYNLNGMSGNSVSVFIDGISISTYGPSFSLNSIPPSLIERIEVYKGVVPAHLSDDALGGAINVVLKKGMQNTLTASIMYGSFNTQQANFNALYRDDKTGFTVKASGFYNYSDNDYEVWGKFVKNILPNGRTEHVRAKRFNDAYRSIGGRFEFGFTNVKWADQFYIGYNASDDYNEIQHGTYMTIPYKGRFTESEAHVFNVDYRKKNLIIPGLEFNLNAVYSFREEVVTDTVKWNYNWFGEISLGLDGEPILRHNGAQQGSPTINHIDRNIATFRTGLSYDINRNHKVMFNHVFQNTAREEQDFMKSEVERSFIDTRDFQKNITSLSYEMKALDEKLTATVFGKYYYQKIDKTDPSLKTVNGESVKVEEKSSSKKTEPGYGLTVFYSVLPMLHLQTSAERAVRMPSEREIFGSPGENIEENFDLKPEISNNINLGIKAGYFTVGNHQFNLGASVFVREIQDKIAQSTDRINDAIQTAPNKNMERAKAKGFELELNYSYGNKLDVSFNMSKFNSVFNTKYDSNGNEFPYYNQQLPNEPYFTINGTAKYTFHNLLQKRSLLNVYYNFGFVDSFYTTRMILEDFQVPRQFIQDVGISYIFPNKRFVLSFDAKNIFDKQAYDNFAVQKPGRAFYVKLNYTVNKF